MDNVKLESRSTIEILNPTRINQASDTINFEEGVRDVQRHENKGVQ
jgi:hypothetical protein